MCVRAGVAPAAPALTPPSVHVVVRKIVSTDLQYRLSNVHYVSSTSQRATPVGRDVRRSYRRFVFRSVSAQRSQSNTTRCGVSFASAGGTVCPASVRIRMSSLALSLSASVKSESASPVALARPVRPMRCT